MTAALFGELTADGQRIALVAQGDHYELNQIGGRIRRFTALPEDAEINGRSTGGIYLPATWATVVQLGFSFSQPGFSWQPQPRLLDWIVTETTRRTCPPPEPAKGYPPWLELRPYQELGAAQIAAGGRFLLLDEPGTGKTITTIAGIDARRLAGTGIFPVVIVVPSWDVADHWAREIRKWAPAWGEPVMHGGPERFGKVARPKGRPPGDSVFLTTYATARIDADSERGPLARLRAETVIADEFHWAKNVNAKQSQALRRIAKHAGTVVGLSGTPVTRNTGDIFPMLSAMDPRSWPSRERMTARYCEKVPDPYDSDLILGLSPQAEPEFRAVMLASMRRVAKADVLPELPPKIYSVRRPEIPREWRAAYREMEQDMLARLPDGDELSVMSTLAQLTRLSQLASSAADVKIVQAWNDTTGEYEDKQVVTLKAPSWKAETLCEILAERAGDPVAVFTVSQQLARITGEDYLAPRGFRYGYVTGLKDGVTRASRQRDIEEFQAGKLDAIICTSGAGGTGITLSRAGTVVVLQRPWPLAEAVQEEDRAQRIGAEEWHDQIEIIDIVARGTVDERVRELLRDKAGQLAQLVRDPRIVRELLGGLT